jgi:RNA polymerase sigma-70 factor (ECF subfamily)
MQPPQDDIAIINTVLQGNAHAYATLVEKYQGYVFTLALRYVKERETAEELAQDVFVKAYRSLGDYKGSCKFSTWLYTIVHTTCLSHLRRHNIPTVFPGADGLLLLAGKPEQPAVEQKHRKAMVEHAIQQLPEADAEVITLYYLAEQSIEETGLITGLTPANVKVRLHRARQRLKEIMCRNNSYYV